MLHPSTKRLIDKLSDMTRKQRVTWTEGENATVVHDTEGYRVVVTPEPHAVLLTDGLGREIETCLPEEFADELDAQGRPYSKFIAELYREASRHARGTEKAIRTLLAGLDAVESEPAPAPAAPVMPPLDLPDATTDETADLESETEITAAVATLADQINGAPMAAAVPPPEAAVERELAPEPEPLTESFAAPEPEPAPVLEPQVAEAPEPEIEAAPVSAMIPEAPAGSVEVAPLDDEPGSFGTFGAFQTAEPPTETAPEQEPAPAPEPVIAEAAAEPAPAPAASVPTLAQPISLSSIPFGFGLGAAQRSGTPLHEPKAAPSPEPAEMPRRLVIDGTLDLPEATAQDFDNAAMSEPYPPAPPQAGPDDLSDDSLPRPTDPGAPRRFNPWN